MGCRPPSLDYLHDARPARPRYRQEFLEQSYPFRHKRNNSGNSIDSLVAQSDWSTGAPDQRPPTPTTPNHFVPAWDGSPFVPAFAKAAPSRSDQSSRLQRRQDPGEIKKALDELEPCPIQMSPAENLAWDAAAKEGQIRDRACRLVWVKAVTNAAAAAVMRPVFALDGSAHAGGMGVGGAAGLLRISSTGNGYGGAFAGLVVDRVPWRELAASLQEHLCGCLTIPSSSNQLVDPGPYGDPRADLDGSARGGGDLDGSGGDSFDMGPLLTAAHATSYANGAGGYGAIDVPAPRGMNEEDVLFVRSILRSKQSSQSGRRGSISLGRGMGGDEEERGGLGLDKESCGDMISVQAFGAFSRCGCWRAKKLGG